MKHGITRQFELEALESRLFLSSAGLLSVPATDAIDQGSSPSAIIEEQPQIHSTEPGGGIATNVAIENLFGGAVDYQANVVDPHSPRRAGDSAARPVERGFIVIDATHLAEFDSDPGAGVTVSLPGADVRLEGDLILNGPLSVSAANITLAAGASISSNAGSVYLESVGDTVIAGRITVANLVANGEGGSVVILGERIGLFGAMIDASGVAGGGTIHVGGAFQGRGEWPTARLVYVSDDSLLTADGQETGSGGVIVVWADEQTQFAGAISARGGQRGGDGGFAEVSGKDQLQFTGSVDLSAQAGSSGTLLLDPDDITISGGAGAAAGDGQLDAGVPAGDILGRSQYAEGGTADFTISEAKLESIDANIDLQAMDSVVVAGTFNNNGNGEGAGGILRLRPGRSLTLSTRNAAGDGSTGINLRGSTHGAALRIQTTGAGAITIETGTDGGEVDVAPIVLCNLITAGGAVSVSAEGALTMPDGTTINAGSGAVNLTSKTSVTVETITTTGTVNVTINAAAGSILRSSADSLLTGSTVTLNGATGIGDAVGSSGNPIRTSAGTVQGRAGSGSFFVTEANGLNLGATTVTGGNLGITATLGNITQSGVLAAGGTASFTTLADDADITLTMANSVLGAASFTSTDTNANNAESVQYAGGGSVILGGVTNAGTLAISAAGSISQTGSLTVGDTASFTVSAAGADLGLNGIGNAIGGAISLLTAGGGSYRDVSLRNNDPGASVPLLPLGLRNVSLILNSAGAELPALSITGNLAVTAGGNIAQSGIVDVNGNASFTSTILNADIELNNLAVTGAVDLHTTGATGHATVVNMTAVILAESSVGGNLDVTAVTGDITDIGRVGVGGTAAFRVLANANGIDLGSLAAIGTISVTTFQDATLVNESGINFADATVGGNLIATANAGPITDSGTLRVGATAAFTASDGPILLNNPANSIGGIISLNASGHATLVNINPVELGNCTVGGNLSVTAVGGDIIASGSLQVDGNSTFAANGAHASITLVNGGNEFSGTVAFSGASGLSNVTVVDSSALDLGGLIISGNLDVEAAEITDSATLIIGGTATLNGESGVTLDTPTNNFNGAVSVTSTADVILTDINGLTLGESAVGGTLTITTRGSLSQIDGSTITVATGATVLSAGERNNIRLDSDANDFVAVTILSAKNVVLSDTDGLELGASVISGTLDVRVSGGELTQAGPLIVRGHANLNADAITLNHLLNEFRGVSLNATDSVELRDANALALGAGEIGGDLTVTAGGDITQTGAVVVAGTARLEVPGARNIKLPNLNNDFATLTIPSAKDVFLTDQSGFEVGELVVYGRLTVAAGGDVVQTAAPIEIGGQAKFNVGGHNLDLSDPSNDFRGALLISKAEDVSISDTNGLVLGLSTIAGNATMATGGPLTQTGTLNIGGALNITTEPASDVILGNPMNDFNSVAVIQAANVSLQDKTGLTLGSDSDASVILGQLTVSAKGLLNQNGSLEVHGKAVLSATPSQDVILDGDANDFAQVSITNARNVQVRDETGDLELGSILATGQLALFTNGAISQSEGAAIKALGPSSFQAEGEIMLGNSANDLRSVAVVSAANAVVRDSNALDLGQSIVAGDLTLRTNGQLTQTGPIAVGELTELQVGASNIVLANAQNDFVDLKVIAARNVTITDGLDDLELSAMNVFGALEIVAAGQISQEPGGALRVTGLANLQSGGGILLGNEENNLGSISIASADDTEVHDINGLNLGATTIVGNLTLRINGHLTQTGSVTVTGTATLSVGSAYDIRLTNTGNAFGNIELEDYRNVYLG